MRWCSEILFTGLQEQPQGYKNPNEFDYMDIKRTTLLSCMPFFLAACSNAPPGCADSATKDLVIDIVLPSLQREVDLFTNLQNMADRSIRSGSQSSPEKLVLTERDVSLNFIRTTEVDNHTGARHCAAVMEVRLPNGSVDLNVVYSSENVEESGSFYVTVHRLY